MSKLQHFQKYQLRYESAAILVFIFINSSILATSVIMEAARRSPTLPFELWDPFVWEYSSGIAILILLPILLGLMKKYPINWNNIKRNLLIYFFASIVYSGLHVLMMVSIRKAAYWTQSRVYDFGDLSFEFIYEYRKDLWGFIFIIIAIKGYQFVLTRLQGEASLINDGEESDKPQDCNRLLVKKLGKEFIVKVADIEWLESSGNYVNLHIKGRIYPLRATLGKLVEQISNKGFCRIHRSYGINLDSIDSITPLASGDSEVKLTNGKTLNLSRRYKDEFKLRLT